MEEQHNTRKKERKRFLFLCFVAVSVVTVALFLSGALYMKYQGARLSKYCNDGLIGESSNQVLVAAREAGFETVASEKLILLTMPGKRHGRTCYLSIGDGAVTDARSAFSW